MARAGAIPGISQAFFLAYGSLTNWEIVKEGCLNLTIGYHRTHRLCHPCGHCRTAGHQFSQVFWRQPSFV